ncbi:MAG: hypothetical protein DI570_20090 [Phenylobacterium zucineum]|nr:MAG: hypothetical protein DI570_20090 [Phenylobacterium zucineum]
MNFLETKMNARRRTGLAIVGGLAAALAGASAQAKPAPDLATALQRVQVADDPLEPAVVITTERVAPSTRGVLSTRYNDNHLRAVVDRRSGEVRYELKQTLQYMGGFRDFQQANYQAPAGVAVAALDRLDSNRVHCEALDTQEACFEVVSFTVPEGTLREMAANAADGWQFKFKPRFGAEHRTQMSRTEIQALLQAVETYRGRSAPAAVQGQH